MNRVSCGGDRQFGEREGIGTDNGCSVLELIADSLINDSANRRFLALSAILEESLRRQIHPPLSLVRAVERFALIL